MIHALEHIIRFEAGYDCIRFQCCCESETCQPGEGGSHGRGPLNIRFVAKGTDGAVQFVLATGWYPQYTKLSSINTRSISCWGNESYPMDLGYHSKKPRYKAQRSIHEVCEFCDGKPCYYAGSGLNASDAMYALVNGGEEALWTFLDAYYECIFHEGEYPQPAEYPRPLRDNGALP